VGPRAVPTQGPLSSLLASSLLVSLSILACAEVRPTSPDTPEIPSREEVFESERLGRPATKGAVDALLAYHARVCEPLLNTVRAGEERPARECFGRGPVAELETLGQLLAVSRGTPDEPAILERMIVDLRALHSFNLISCRDFSLKPAPTVRDVEAGVADLRALQDRIERSRAEPDRICAELRLHFPARPRRVQCPGDPPRPDAEGPDTDPSGWPLPGQSPSDPSTVKGL